MSSTKASSSKDRGEKRRSDKTRSDDKKSKKGDRGNASISKQAKKAEQGTEYYDVYVVKLNTELRHADYHRSLFVEIVKPQNKKDASRGYIFEVQGPFDVSRTKSEYRFYFLHDKAPQNTSRFVNRRKIGQVASDRVMEIYGVCDGVRVPCGPARYEGHPDCNDWLNNIIFRLKESDIIEFVSDYTGPTEEVSMVWSTGTT